MCRIPQYLRQFWTGFLVSAIAIVLAATGMACGPNFPNRFLMHGDSAVVAAPVPYFKNELERVMPEIETRFEARPPEGGEHGVQTAETATEELKAALTGGNGQTRDIEGLVKRFEQLRSKLQDFATLRRVRRNRESMDVPLEDFPQVAVPRGLPQEFGLYLKGAIAYYRLDWEEARSQWNQVLKLPADSRRYRSTWAAFMLGKTWIDEDPAKAIAWFRTVRELAGDAFKDRLGLAAASIGWEAKAHLDSGYYLNALLLYLRHYACEHPSALVSLKHTAKRAMDAERSRLHVIAEHPIGRRVVTAYLISEGQWDATLRWLDILKTISGSVTKGADRLALAAYQRGRFETTRRWLDQVEGANPLTEWLEAKLRLRHGDIEQAAEKLQKVVDAFPKASHWRNIRDFHDLCDFGFSPKLHAFGELGVLYLSREEYAQALHALLQGGFWLDAAYVAERVMRPDELKEYVDRYWQASEVEASRIRRSFGSLSQEEIPQAIRHLLARRLGRNGEWKEALPYFPKSMRETVQDYSNALKRGLDADLPERVQGQALWKAARIARDSGLQIMGTEIDPDWAFFEGQYDPPSVIPRRRHPLRGQLTASTYGERQRLERHVLKPSKRFHYRYVAGELGWRAALKLPDNAPRTARVLWQAGTWLKNRDPEAADRFYKALVRRCRETSLGRKADQIHWFPTESWARKKGALHLKIKRGNR